MNLYVFPEAPVLSNGYGIAVRNDYLRLKPHESDDVVWYSNILDHNLKKKHDYIINKDSIFSIKRIKSILRGNPSVELTASCFDDIRFDKIYDSIFCGDVIAYRALRLKYPNQYIIVRFHNCFSRIQNRINVLDIDINNLKFKLNLSSISNLEHEIFRDLNCKKIFISTEDKEYYSLITGRVDDCEVWDMQIDQLKALNARKINSPTILNKFVWFGGAESHKIDSIKWFRDSIFPELEKYIPDAEFHLYGKFTEKLKCPNPKVFAHGFYPDNDFPFKKESLYINPDLIGGGIKTKLKSYYEAGIPFISTPFGFEGFSKTLADPKYCLIAQPNEWINRIISRINS